MKCMECSKETTGGSLWCDKCLSESEYRTEYMKKHDPKKWYRTKRATKVYTDKEAGYNVVQYHNTDVVMWNDDEIILDTGGYDTLTTKARMNEASRVYDLGFHVYQKNYNWYVEYKGETILFTSSTLTLSRKEPIPKGFPDVWGVKTPWPPVYNKFMNDLK